MRVLLQNLFLSLVSFSSLNSVMAQDVENNPSAVIEKGRFDAEANVVVLTVRYGGGCAEHKFELKSSGCEGTGFACTANLVKTAGFEDRCRSIVRENIRLPLDFNLAEEKQMVVFGAEDSKTEIAFVEENIDHSPALVLGGVYESASNELVLDVQYAGGCAEHSFDLNYGECNEYTCVAKLHRLSGFEERCKGIIQKSIRIPVDFGEMAPSATNLKIFGGNESSVFVELN